MKIKKLQKANGIQGRIHHVKECIDQLEVKKESIWMNSAINFDQDTIDIIEKGVDSIKRKLMIRLVEVEKEFQDL